MGEGVYHWFWVLCLPFLALAALESRPPKSAAEALVLLLELCLQLDTLPVVLFLHTCNLVVQLSLGVHLHILFLVELVPEVVITSEILILPVIQPILLGAMILFLILQMQANYFQFLLMIPFHMK